MLRTLALVLPVLIPSWRFFKAIRPSPRVQWAILAAGEAEASNWQEFRPRPERVSPIEMLWRLVWNPVWNESLFLVSCAERIQEMPTQHSISEIERRILREIARMPGDLTGDLTGDMTGKEMQFRLIFVQQGPQGWREDLVFLSRRYPIDGDSAP